MSILLITLIYACLSLWRLGSFTFPSTTWQPDHDSSSSTVTFFLPDTSSFQKIYVIYGEGDNNSLSAGYQLGTEDVYLYGSFDNNTYQLIQKLDTGSIYTYSIYEGNWEYPYVRIYCDNPKASISEIGFYNTESDSFLPVTVEDETGDPDYPASLLIDEQDKLISDPTYYDQAYFDEVYHVRNAWEIANHQRMYSYVHPLLGTQMIALGIRILGMSPFAWRFPGTLAGIMMIPLLYAIAMRLFNDQRASVVAACLFAFDFMHITTSRIATLEPFSILCILLMFYFMIRYIQTDLVLDPLRKQWKYLLWCGLSTGCAIAVKWTGCYGALGMAVLLFAHLIHQMMMYKKAGLRNLLLTLLICFPCFIFIPILIYWGSFLPCTGALEGGWSFMRIYDQNISMYSYHKNLTATHPCQSSWYQWLLDYRPVWYAFAKDANGLYHTIACFSHPLLTWVGVPCVLLTAVDGLVHRKGSSFIVLTGFLVFLVPWISFVERCIFAYHFYPSSLFVSLSIGYAVWRMPKDAVWYKTVNLFMVLYLFIALLFLPITAGFGTSIGYIHAMEWLKGWYFG